MNKSISELEPIDQVNHDDILLISKKTDNGYVSRKINTAILIEPALTAMELFKDEQQRVNATFQQDLTAVTAGHMGLSTLSKAEAIKPTLSAGTLIEITNDGDNNGVYILEDGNLKKSDYDPFGQARIYFDGNLSKILQDGKNLYDSSKKQVNKYIVSTTGLIRDAAGWSCSDYIPVIVGQPYTISSTLRRSGLAFYDSNRTYIADSYVGTLGGLDPKTVTAPPTAAYLVINIDSDTVSASNVQVENGSVATFYEPYQKTLHAELLKSLVAKSELATLFKTVVTKPELAASLAKPYEVTTMSRNLFDKSKIAANSYLNSTNGGIQSNAPGWGRSDMIPVTPGQTYTLSGARGRQGLAWFANDTDTSAISYNASIAMPLTVTAPPNANFVSFNLYSSSAPNYSNIQFEQGSTATAYQDYGTIYSIDSKYLTATSSNNDDKNCKLNIGTDNQASINAHLVDGTSIKLDLLLTKTNTHDNSTVFNFAGDTINGVVQRTLNDDVAPVRAFGTTIGANHGYAKTKITANAHGKATADIGSVWSNGVKEWLLIDIVDVNNLLMTARLDNTYLATGTLTHVSGATNTASITSTAKADSQWYPAFKNRQLSCFVDDTKIDLSVVSNYAYSDKVTFHESYEIMDKNDIVAWIIANKGKTLANYDAPAALLVNVSYEFDINAGCTIYTSITALKSIAFADWMATQSVKLSTSNLYYYVPKSIPFNQDNINYDFSKPYLMPGTLPSSIYFKANKNESDANPVDRLLMFNDNYGYATGYLPMLDAEPSKRMNNAANDYLEIRNNSLKVYPRVIDGLKTQLNVGDSFAVVAYRKYFAKSTKRTSQYVIRSKMGDYLYLDWHTATTDTITLPDDLIGRSFTVHEKSSNVTLLSTFATNNIVVQVDSSKSYGYLVLKFTK